MMNKRFSKEIRNKEISEEMDARAIEELIEQEIISEEMDARAIEELIEQERINEEMDARAIEELIEEEKISEEWEPNNKIEEEEFEQLVEEIKNLNFTYSKEVSNYIMENRLGIKYKNISGVVKMEKDGNSWDFKGGFSPKIYYKLCKELGLSDKGSHAKAVNFTPFKNLNPLLDNQNR